MCVRPVEWVMLATCCAVRAMVCAFDQSYWLFTPSYRSPVVVPFVKHLGKFSALTTYLPLGAICRLYILSFRPTLIILRDRSSWLSGICVCSIQSKGEECPATSVSLILSRDLNLWSLWIWHHLWSSDVGDRQSSASRWQDTRHHESPGLVRFYIHNMRVLRGSVATRWGVVGIFNGSFVANCPRSAPVKDVLKLTNIWQRFWQTLVACF